MFTHYWTGNEPAEVRQAQFEDWLVDLAEFSPEAVEAASIEWRRANSRRPTIAELRPIVAEAQGRIDARRRVALPPSDGFGFPSHSDRDYLRDKVNLKKGPGYSALTPEEKRRWHAYDYAFQQIFMLRDWSPLDPDRKHFDMGIVAAATRFFRTHGMQTAGKAPMRDAAE